VSQKREVGVRSITGRGPIRARTASGVHYGYTDRVDFAPSAGLVSSAYQDSELSSLGVPGPRARAS
jgi:hypothetical protein